MMRGYLHRHNHWIQPAASQEVDDSYQSPAEGAALILESARNARQGKPPCRK
jgi:hypothetical protein